MEKKKTRGKKLPAEISLNPSVENWYYFLILLEEELASSLGLFCYLFIPEDDFKCNCE